MKITAPEVPPPIRARTHASKPPRPELIQREGQREIEGDKVEEIATSAVLLPVKLWLLLIYFENIATV